MTRFQLQGQSKELTNDWSTEYVTQENDEAVTFDTYEEAKEMMDWCISEYNSSEEQFRIIEIN